MEEVKIWFNYGNDFLANYVNNLIDKEGVLYREKAEPVKIEILKKEEVRTISGNDVFMDKGTILLEGSHVITSEQFDKNYMPYKDQNGEIVPNMYVPIFLSDVIKNPFGKPILDMGIDDYYVRYDEECYIVRMRYLFDWIRLVSKKEFEETFEEVTNQKQFKL